MAVNWCEADGDAELETVEPLSTVLAQLPSEIHGRLIHSANRHRAQSDRNEAEFASMHEAFEGIQEGDRHAPMEPMANLIASLPPTWQRRLVASARRSRRQATRPFEGRVNLRGERPPRLAFEEAVGVNAVAVAVCEAAAGLEERAVERAGQARRYVCEYHK